MFEATSPPDMTDGNLSKADTIKTYPNQTLLLSRGYENFKTFCSL